MKSSLKRVNVPVRMWRTIVFFSGGAYLCALPLWFILRLLFFDRFWWLALLNTVAFYLFLPLAIVLPLAVLYRQRQIAFGSLLGFVLFALVFHPLVNPFAKRSAPEPSPSSLTVMSFNVLWKNESYDALVQMVQRVQPDIIGIQEVSARKVEALAAALAPDYPYFTHHPVARFHTVGLLSRLPIATVAALPSPLLERGVEVIIQDDTRPLRILVAHLAPNNMPLWPPNRFITTTIDRYAQRTAEVRLLQDRITERVMPTLLLCDCNMTDTSETYAMLRTVVHDSFQARGWGLGHTLFVNHIPLPVQRIDYIWHTEDIHVIDAFVGPDGGSDHLPIIAIIRRDVP